MSQRPESSENATTVTNVVEIENLPLAPASHENVVRDSPFFHYTMQEFHSALGSKFSEPMVGSKRINLHALYVEVTKRGGYEKVTTDKKWAEVGKVFQVLPTTASASYALKKHYHTLLHGYELMYFRLEDPKLKETEPTSQTFGYIDGKFDCGYLVTVKIGDEWLDGMLWQGHPADNVLALTPPPVLLPQPLNAIVPYNPPVQRRGRGIKRRRKGDPGRPKTNRSGYNFFFSDKHAELKSLHAKRERDFTKMIADAWNKMTAAEKALYQERGVNDKKRYESELAAYKLGVMADVEVHPSNFNKIMVKESGKAKL